MRGALLAIALLIGLMAGPVGAQTLARAWEVQGFENPASAVWDGERKVVYVSNVNGAPADKDGNGYISQVSANGRVLSRKWVTGLDGPKGMAVQKGRLYVTDIDRLVVIDTQTGKLLKSYPVATAKFLNDVTVDKDGRVYVADMLGNVIWRLTDGQFEKWVEGKTVEAPSALLAERERLMVATWGLAGGEDFESTKSGRLKSINFNNKAVSDLSAGIGHLAGLENDHKGGYLVSDYTKGTIYRVSRTGKVRPILALSEGAAGIAVIDGPRLLLVPMTGKGTLAAYRLR